MQRNSDASQQSDDSVSATQRRMYLREAGLQLLYNGADVKFSASFGVTPRVIDSNAVFLDEEEDMSRATVAYICSEQLTTYRLHSKEQDYLPREAPGQVTFLASLRRKDGLVYILAEQHKDAGPDLLVISAANKKTQRLAHTHLMQGAAIRQARLPRDAAGAKNICITLSDSPATFTVWRIDKQKLLFEKPARVQSAVFDQCPESPLQVVLCGPKYLRLWEINPQEATMEETGVHLVPLKFERDNDFIDLKFVPFTSTLVVLAVGNKVIVFENYEQTRLITDVFSPKFPGQSPKPRGFEVEFSQITARETVETTKGERLILLPKGFCVCGTGGFFAIYEAEEGRPPAHITTARAAANVARIISGSVSADGNYLLLACALLETDLPEQSEDAPALVKIDFFVATLRKVENELPDAVLPLFAASQHCGAVRDVAIALGKNLVITVGEDHHLRIWHKASDWSGVIDHRLQEAPLSVTVHPTGSQLAVGFKESLKVFAVLHSELLTELDHVVKSCYAVSYSPGGKYLAANSAGTITLFSPYTLRALATLSGHFSAVHSLSWDSDQTLTSACFGGAVLVWNTSTGEQKSAEVPRQGKVLTALYDEQREVFAVLTNDGVVKVIGDSGQKVTEIPANGNTYTALHLSLPLGLLFLGCASGTLRTTLWPVAPDPDHYAIDFQDFQFHSAAITKIAVSEFHDSVATASADSCVLVHSLKLVRNGAQFTANSLVGQSFGGSLQSSESLATNHLALVRRDAIEVYESKIKDLEDSISTLKSQNKYAMETKDHEHYEELERTKRDYEEKLRYEQDYSAGLKREMEARGTEFAGKMKALEESQQQQLESEVQRHEQLQAEDQERYDLLKEETEDLKRRMGEEIANLLAMHKEVKAAIETECRNRLEEVRTAYEGVMDAMKKQGERFEAGLSMTEKEYEEELTGERAKLEQLLMEERENVKNLRLANTRLNSERENIVKKDEELQKELQALKESQQQVKSESEELKARIGKMQEQITEREEVIKKKENSIKELRSFNIHLQNFRFVLDQKIKTLKEDRGPLGEQLTALQEHIRSMYAELLQEFEKTRACMKEVADLQGRNKSLMEQHKILRNRVLFAKRKVALIQSDLVSLLKITNKDTLLMGLKQLIDKHLDIDDMVASGDEDEEVASLEEANLSKVRAEVIHQHDLMKEQLLAVQKRSKALEHKKNHEMQRKMQENASLIQECNSLRDINRDLQRDNVVLKDRISKLKSQLKEQVTGELSESGKVRNGSDSVRGRAPLELAKVKPRLAKTVSRPNFHLSSLINELERNKSEIMEQNTQFKKLQEQVSNFLGMQNSPRSHDPTPELPSLRGQGLLSQSTTVPTLHSSVDVESFHQRKQPSPTVQQEAV